MTLENMLHCLPEHIGQLPHPLVAQTDWLSVATYVQFYNDWVTSMGIQDYLSTTALQGYIDQAIAWYNAQDFPTMINTALTSA